MSVELLFVRHGETPWNAAKRIQGHTDVDLSPRGESQVRSQRVPRDFGDFLWIASPLQRCRRTARLMGGTEVSLHSALIEMSWGDWEGQTLADLRKAHGEEMRDRESLGLDFRPPNGESPRDVQARLSLWLISIRDTQRSYVAVTHKGVIRAALSLATGWDMRDKPPVKLPWHCGHHFTLNSEGGLSLVRANVGLL